MKCLIYGIDGGTWDVVRPLLNDGQLPNLDRLIHDGVYAPLRSTLPPASGPAWASLITGLNPGQHGVFDFWERDLRTYLPAPTTLSDSGTLAGRTLWDLTSAAGFRVGAVSVPITYPAWPVNGFMVSGSLLATGVEERSAYPPDVARRYGHSLSFPEAYRYGSSPDEVMRAGPEMMLRRRDVILQLLAEYACEVLVVVMGETDKAQHDFWRYTEADCSPKQREQFGHVIDDHYRVVDQVLGAIVEAMGPDMLVAVVSDHGAGPYPRRRFHTNAWLRQQGLLTLRKGPQRAVRQALGRVRGLVPRGLYAAFQRLKGGGLAQALWKGYAGVGAINWQATKAYRVPMEWPVEGIEINLAGRQPEGHVAAADYRALVTELAGLLREVVDAETGDRVFDEVHSRDEVYSGSYVEQRAPDLVCVFAPDYGGAWGNEPPLLDAFPATERMRHRGSHGMDGILVLSGPGIRRGTLDSETSVLDVAPTVLHALGLPVPANMDGRVLLEAFDPEHAAPVRYAEPVPAGQPSESRLSREDTERVVDRLRGLGYL